MCSSHSFAEAFARDGYVIARGLAPRVTVERLRVLAEAELERARPPIEYEADVHYPGAPPSRAAPGGRTARRLLQAYQRDPAFREWALNPEIVARVRALLGDKLVLPLAHHNCVMTKQPRFSSDTGWHQDIRYWSFSRPELVSVWLALGAETRANGCLRLLPGTHRPRFERSRLDERLFLREDLPENRALVEREIVAELEAGDVLFFHALTFHAAERNRGDATKFSLVFTYRAADNAPLPGSRSAGGGDIPISE